MIKLKQLIMHEKIIWIIGICSEAVLLHSIFMYIFYGDQCLQYYTLTLMNFCLSLRNAIAGYFVFRWIGKWRLINFKGKAPTPKLFRKINS